MTSHNEAQKIEKEMRHWFVSNVNLGSKAETEFMSQLMAEKLITLITPKQEAQKTKADWLRSEIEKLEAVIRDFIARWEHPDSGLALEHTVKSETIYHLTSIITRYKEELEGLESK